MRVRANNASGSGGGGNVIYFQSANKSGGNSSNSFAIGKSFSDYFWAINYLMYHVNNGVVQYTTDGGATWTTDNTLTVSISGTTITISGTFSGGSVPIALVALE